jgi:hypothetical protein
MRIEDLGESPNNKKLPLANTIRVSIQYGYLPKVVREDTWASKGHQQVDQTGDRRPR